MVLKPCRHENKYCSCLNNFYSMMIYSISKIIVLSPKFENISTHTKMFSCPIQRNNFNSSIYLLRPHFKQFLGNFPYYWKFILITFSFPFLNFFCWYVSTSFCFIDFLRKEVIEATWLDIFLLIYIWDYLDLIRIASLAGGQSYQRDQPWLCSLKSMGVQ